MNLTRLRAIKPTRSLVSYQARKSQKIILPDASRRDVFWRKSSERARSHARVITHGGHGQAVTRASKLAIKKIMWQKLILGATLAVAAAADGAAKPAFLQACEDDGDAGCAAKLATAAAGDDVATVEASV